MTVQENIKNPCFFNNLCQIYNTTKHLTNRVTTNIKLEYKDYNTNTRIYITKDSRKRKKYN